MASPYNVNERVNLIDDGIVKYHTDNETECERNNNTAKRKRQRSWHSAQDEEVGSGEQEAGLRERLRDLEEKMRDVKDKLEQQTQLRGQPEQRQRVPLNKQPRRCHCCRIDWKWSVVLVSVIVACASLGIGIDNQVALTAVTIGTTYEIVGSRSCPSVSGTTEIYSGVIVGFTTTTGSTSYQCMSNNSDYIEYHRSNLSEYTGDTPVHFVNTTQYLTFRENRTGNEVACAKCSIDGRSAIEILPTTKECPPSWTKEYGGYLMTDSGSTGFVCVDTDMKSPRHNYTTNPTAGGPTLSHVVAALDIHSKYNGSEVLSCVVCSK